MIDTISSEDGRYTGIVFFKSIGVSCLTPASGERTVGVTVGAYEARLYFAVQLWWWEFDIAIGTDLLPKEEQLD